MKITLSGIERAEKKAEKIEDRAWADAVKDRDGWKCVICSDPIKPNAHHIIPRENRCSRLKIENGITLCVKHHKFDRLISAHNNPIAFFFWLAENRPVQFGKAKDTYEELLYATRPVAETSTGY